jgi:hypothetical protein
MLETKRGRYLNMHRNIVVCCHMCGSSRLSHTFPVFVDNATFGDPCWLGSMSVQPCAFSKMIGNCFPCHHTLSNSHMYMTIVFCTCSYVCLSVHAYVDVRVHVRTCACLHTCACLCVSMCVRVLLCVGVCVGVCVGSWWSRGVSGFMVDVSGFTAKIKSFMAGLAGVIGGPGRFTAGASGWTVGPGRFLWWSPVGLPLGLVGS